MARDGEEYQLFLNRAHRAMFDQSPAFRAALLATGAAVLTLSHSEPPAAT